MEKKAKIQMNLLGNKNHLEEINLQIEIGVVNELFKSGLLEPEERDIAISQLKIKQREHKKV